MSRVREERPSASQTRTWDDRSVVGQKGHLLRHFWDSRRQDQLGWPAGHCTACPALSQKLLPNPQAAHGPGDGAQIREGKNKFSVSRSRLPLSHKSEQFCLCSQ